MRLELSRNVTVHRLSPDGFVCDWLISPVTGRPCEDLGLVVDADGSPWDRDGKLGRWRLTQGPDVAPVKDALYAAVRPALPESVPTTGDDLDRHHTPPNGVIERSIFCYTPTYRTFTATTVLEVDQPETRVLRFRSTGPLRVWVGGVLVLDHAEFGYMHPWVRDVEVLLPSGATEVAVWSLNVALREVRQTVSLQIVGLPVRVLLPTPGADPVLSAQAEALLEGVGVRTWESDGQSFELSGPVGARLQVSVNGASAGVVQLGAQGRATVTVDEAKGDSSQASMLGTGEMTVRVEVDDDRAAAHRDFLVANLPFEIRDEPVGGPEDWRLELLTHVAASTGSARALARAALSADGIAVTEDDLATALQFIADRCDCADFETVGLMLLWHRVPAERWELGLRDRVRDALLGFKYWIDQPGLDAMCYFTENHQMVWHTAETLVGEVFADEKFTNAGWTGAEHAAHGSAMALAWIRRKLTSGFSEFDSNAYLAIDALALVALVDHASDQSLRTAARTLLDKVLLTLATNSWRGVHGAAHGRSYTPTLRAACLEETAPIMWWAWGMGALNEAVLPATALATSPSYAVPEVVRAIATDADADWTGTQHYEGAYAFERDLLVRDYASDMVIRRGRGGMVASVQDYRYGLPGLQEHVWGITLPGQLQVWAVAPAAYNHGSHTRPSGWVGNLVLPRVRQHDRTVIALYAEASAPTLPAVHLWFPADRFEEWAEYGEWLIGRRGVGLVAVAAEGGFEPDRTGDEAWQRWVPRTGRSLVAVHGDDSIGSLEDFADSLPTLTWRRDGGALVDGPASLELDWNGPFLVDGSAADVARPPHLTNPACTVVDGTDPVVVRWGGRELVLPALADEGNTV
ncbi:hypothetical protein Back2_10480 [Nocardioides baekrokdamisoli]|uniref:Uncharacterized protein n=1 Tax=Nocardioides baekrokdamisoli TaxID=1804624 RepID=A0A3G9IT15_9ACTN|nr:hypothetical protein [Nocardioides baekrokdamisoli]BBH16761.1 hypothetical protein Back2_10480 [Nocardioides baekrokdamisoli]